jgi:hypothetical protein
MTAAPKIPSEVEEIFETLDTRVGH